MKQDIEQLTDIKIHDELFLFWLSMKNAKDGNKRDEIIEKTVENIEKYIKKICNKRT